MDETGGNPDSLAPQMPDTLQETAELSLPDNFALIVKESQDRWLTLQKRPYKTVSQAWNLPPENAKYVFDLTLRSIPTYIDSALSEKIREKHPTPLLGFSVLVDERLMQAKETGPFVFMSDVSDQLSDEDKRAWFEGMNLLDEVANDALASDVLSQISSREKQGFVFLMADLESGIPPALSKPAGVSQVEKFIKEKAGERYDELKKRLITAMLTGKHEEVNSYLKEEELGTSLDDLALELGKKFRYGGKLREAIERPFLNKVLKRVRLPLGAGQRSTSYPGVISIYPLGMGLEGPLKGVVHEICHYLGQDSNHLGLLKGKYKTNV